MSSAVPERTLLGIGEVIQALRPDFPDVTISKIRFLESEGLVRPARTASGYRKFSPVDVERLRYVLRMQRDHYLPLKVIREHLDALDRGLEPPSPTGGEAKAPRALVSVGTAGAGVMAFLGMCMECYLNVLVAGNTGSGKTSTLNSLFSFIPADERIILVEETPEISLPHRHLVRLSVCDELGVRMDELVSDTLRMRPDRVIVGEVRTPQESRAFVNTMLAGQGKGSYATFHAQTGREALTRLQSFGISAADLFALDLIVVQRRWAQKGKLLRRVTEIAVQDSGRLEPAYGYDFRKDSLDPKSPFCGKILERMRAAFCLEKGGLASELKRRAGFLKSDAGSYGESLRAIRGYCRV